MNKTIKIFFFFVFIINIYSCSNSDTYSCTYINQYSINKFNKIQPIDSLNLKFIKLLTSHGFIAIKDIDSTILFNSKYNTENNFTGINLYKNYNTMFVHLNMAEMLKKVQQDLKLINKGYSIVIYDALRPHFIQKLLWDSCKLVGIQKRNLLSSPFNKSLHSYGAAIDVTLALNGIELDMGTPFDFVGHKAYTYNQNQLLQQGLLTQNQYMNRMVLQKVMFQNGFIVNKYEWWHFNACYRNEVQKKYPLVVSFDSIQSLPAIQ